MDDQSKRVSRVFEETIDLHRRVSAGDLGPVVDAARLVTAAIAGRGKLLVCGNGGSALDAQHVAAELVGRFRAERPPLAAIALTADTSILTSIANDFSYDDVFARQIHALAACNDVLLAISTSGRSKNVQCAVDAARSLGLKCIALTGFDGGSIGPAADIHINVPSRETARTQEVHRTILHAICDLIEAGVST
ncbi:MAG TPA: SIS domain-containing protein [Vicinamibacterales bacterium]|nr:SIS domain-containing protein [Vicinamibacterales bacterium]